MLKMRLFDNNNNDGVAVMDFDSGDLDFGNGKLDYFKHYWSFLYIFYSI